MKHAHKVNMEFCYTSAASTNIARTIKREQRRLAALKAEQDEAQKMADEEAARKVTAMGKRKQS